MQLLQANIDQNEIAPIIGCFILVGVFWYLLYRRVRILRVMNSGISKQAEVIAVKKTNVSVKPNIKMAYITVSFDSETGKRKAVAWQGFTNKNMPTVGQLVEIRIDKKDENFIRINI